MCVSRVRVGGYMWSVRHEMYVKLFHMCMLQVINVAI